MNDIPNEADGEHADLDILIDPLIMETGGRLMTPAEWTIIWRCLGRCLGRLGFSGLVQDRFSE